MDNGEIQSVIDVDFGCPHPSEYYLLKMKDSFETISDQICKLWKISQRGLGFCFVDDPNQYSLHSNQQIIQLVQNWINQNKE